MGVKLCLSQMVGPALARPCAVLTATKQWEEARVCVCPCHLGCSRAWEEVGDISIAKASEG